MTSTVKYDSDARTGRAPDVVDTGVTGTGALGLGGDTEIAPPSAIVDCEPATALGF